MAELTLLAGGQLRRLTAHASEQMVAREISSSWIVQTLEEPVTVIDDESNNSLNYFGRIPGRNPLLKVAVSKSDYQLIVTIHFDSPATRRYERGRL
jgi:hypothetical protein